MPWETPSVAGNMLTASMAVGGKEGSMIEAAAAGLMVALYWGAMWMLNRDDGSED